MQDEINILKTREKRKLIYRESFFFRILDTLFAYVLISMIPFLSIINIYHNGFSESSIIYLLLSILLYGFLVYSTINVTKLRSFHGIDYTENRKRILKILEKTDWKINVNRSNLIIANENFHLLSWDWGKELVIIFEKNEILINCISFGQSQMKSPFHWFVNRKRENEIIREFEKTMLKLQKNII
jgi:hypothetical protein